MTAKWCDADGLDGGLSSFAGTGSTAMAAVDTTAQNLKLNFMVVAGQYAGGRVNFDSCVDASGLQLHPVHGVGDGGQPHGLHLAGAASDPESAPEHGDEPDGRNVQRDDDDL